MPQVPRHNFSVWNKLQLTGPLAVGVGVVQRTDMFAAIDNTVVVPGYTRADAAVYYSISENWHVQANVENVTNRRYTVNSDSNTNLSPGSPRSGRVMLRARF